MHKKTIFHWDDPLRLELQLTDVEKAVRQEAFEYAQEFLAPRVIEATRTEKFDPSIVREMGEQLAGLWFPRPEPCLLRSCSP